MTRPIHPFEQLKQLAQRVRDQAAPLPERSGKDNSWQAIAFQLNEATMLIDMNAVSEVSPQPPVTKLPGVKRWVLGISNVRGEVLAIVDLHELFELGGSRTPHLNRVIAIEEGDTRLGMVVDRVIGMRQVSAQEMREQTSEECPESLKTCISGSVLIDGQWMDIFDPEKLVKNENFLSVSTL
jgi:twitching motility protein PilI